MSTGGQNGDAIGGARGILVYDVTGSGRTVAALRISAAMPAVLRARNAREPDRVVASAAERVV
jgi:hypothetical protein